jgi:hypothetical protein
MGISLNGLTPAGTYPGLIKTGDNTAISGTPKVLSDGNGNNLPMEVSTTGVNFTNNLTQGGVAVPTASQVAAKQDTLVSGTNIKTINGTSVLGSGNITTPNVSGVAGAIQFSDGSAFASDAANFFWNNTTKRLGVGTNNPQDRCEVNGNIRVGASAFVYSSAGGGAVTSGLFLDSSTSKVSVYTNSAERVIFGASTVATIKGSGSTSATTSLLVQDSTGQEMFRIRDNNQIDFRQGQLSWINPAANCWRAVNGGSNVVGTHWLQSGNFIINDGTSLSNFNSSVMLGVVSTTKGFLPPVMTTTQKSAISAIPGLVVYDSTTNKLCCYNGSTWNDLF